MKFDGTYIEELTPEMIAGPWTSFHDCHSGGGTNTKYSEILIQANYQEAKAVFGARFDMNVNDVNCSCCGSNWSVSDGDDDLAQLTGYGRNLEPVKGYNGGYIEGQGRDMTRYGGKVEIPVPLILHVNRKDICVIFATEIKPEEREAWNIPDARYPYEYESNEDDDDEE